MSKRQSFIRCISMMCVFIGLMACALGCAATENADGARPDIILIMADDMGFSDLGCFGGEIDTPHLDRLAERGVRFTQFYNTGRCCPSRSSLLTGLYAHAAGMGGMTYTRGKAPAYRGQLRDDAATIAEHLRAADYGTYIAGKWHQTWTDTLEQGPNGSWPRQRGFDHFYGTMEGAKDYFNPKWFYDDADEIKSFDKDFFYTTAISQRAAKWITEHDKRKPLFLYAAFYAPHFPLHAPAETVEKYKKTYEAGWDRIRAARYKKQREIGLLDSQQLSPRDPAVPAWDDLTDAQREELAYRMAIYAAQVDELDKGVGRIVAALEQSGRLDNTLIVFLSDNGGTHAGGLMGRGKASDLNRSGGGYTTYGTGWANVSNTPYRLYKSNSHEGGVRTSAIVSWPGVVTETGGFNHEVCHIIDLAPTLVDAAGAEPLTHLNDQKVLTMHGQSLVPVFNGKRLDARPIFFEHEGNRGLRQGKWKLVARKNSAWELYDIDKDPVEVRNLAEREAGVKRELIEVWKRWAKTHGVKH